MSAGIRPAAAIEGHVQGFNGVFDVRCRAGSNRLLADDFVLVTGSGKAYTKADLLDDARSGRKHYEHQEDTEQIVRVWGATAVVTARLWAKGTDQGKPFEYTVWFSDTYVRAPAGWRYSFGQASLPQPKVTR